MPELKLTELGQRVLEEGGFEVFVHAMHRPDLNDWVKNESCYVRALHNIKFGPYYGGPTYASGIGMKRLVQSYLDMKPEHMLQISAPNARPYTIGEGKQRMPIRVSLLAERIYDEQYDTGRKTTAHTEVPSPGFWGKLGMKTVQESQVPVLETRKTYTPARLGDILDESRDRDGLAYVLTLSINKEIREGGPRPRAGHTPEISLIAGKALSEDLVSYALRNPGDYYDLIRAFIPEDRFPNVYRGILSPPMRNSEDGRNHEGVEAWGLVAD